MIDRARANAADAGVDGWTEFLLGEMERVPLPDASATSWSRTGSST